jgi:hypothetical protein
MKRHLLKPLIPVASLLTLRPPAAVVVYSPLPVRLKNDFFDFSKARADGADLGKG